MYAQYDRLALSQQCSSLKYLPLFLSATILTQTILSCSRVCYGEKVPC